METTRKFKYDDGTVYTQGATPKPSTSSVAQPQQPVIPVSVVDGTTPSVDIPQAQTPAIPTPYSISDIFQNQSKALSDQQAALQKQRDPYVAQMQSLLGGQMNMGNDYLSALNSSGVNEQQQLLQRDLERLSTLEQRSRDMQTAFDKQLSDMELRGASSDITKGTYNAQASRASREFSFQQRGVASQIEAQAAIVQARQGNIAAATDHIKYMLNLKWQGTESALQQERYFLDKLDNQLSANQKEQSDLRKQQLDAQLTEIQDAKKMVTQAVASGGASAEEIALMSDPNITPGEQMQIAQQILGRTAASDRALERQNLNSQIQSRNVSTLLSLAEKGDQNAIAQLGFDPRATTGNFEAESSLRKELNGLKPIQSAQEVQQSYKQIQGAYEQAVNAGNNNASKSAADQALIISFNKMLDPGSVVREGEFARSTEGQSIINQIKGRLEAAQRGGTGLTDQDRQSIVQMTQRLYGDYVTMHNDIVYDYRQNAKRQGGDPNYVAGYMDTIGLTAQNAEEGAVIIVNGQPFQKVQGEMVMLTDI